MREITIVLSEGQYRVLVRAAAQAREAGFNASEWAREAVESVLASRRLPRVARGRHGARLGVAEEAEPVGHRVFMPEPVGACG